MHDCRNSCFLAISDTMKNVTDTFTAFTASPQQNLSKFLVFPLFSPSSIKIQISKSPPTTLKLRNKSPPLQRGGGHYVDLAIKRFVKAFVKQIYQKDRLLQTLGLIARFLGYIQDFKSCFNRQAVSL